MLALPVFLGGNLVRQLPLECPHLRPGDGCLRRAPSPVGHPRIACRRAETASPTPASGDLAGDDGERKPGDQDEADEGERDPKREHRPGRAIRVAVEARSIVLPHGKTSRLRRESPIAPSAQPTVHPARREAERASAGRHAANSPLSAHASSGSSSSSEAGVALCSAATNPSVRFTTKSRCRSMVTMW
jgi:hypothetical protein